MNKLIAGLQAFPSALYRWVFFSALAFTLFMALIPGSADPTGFINDKVKHALTFMVLFALLDLAFRTKNGSWRKPLAWGKPLALLAFGVFIEVCQKMTGYRAFSIGDIAADTVGILGYIGLKAVYSVRMHAEIRSGTQPSPP